MTCLTSAQVQAVVDGEATPTEREHARSCESCRRRVDERQSQLARLNAAVDGIDMPIATVHRVDAALTGGSAAGATRLRAEPAPGASRRAVWGTLAVAAATLVAVLFVAPMMKEDRGAVSASEVLAASANRLAQPIGSGVEILEYELVLDGVPKELMPDHPSGTYHVRQAIDHGVPGRFRFSSYDPSGQLYSSIAQDPVAGHRVMVITLDGHRYRFDVSVPANVGPSIPEMERLHMEATIALMQASGDQHLEVIDTPDGRQYRIEVPKVSTPIANPVWDLSEARVLIDARDYRVTELAVKGNFLKQPYSVSYRLINRLIADSVPPDTFEVPSQAGEIVITGEGSVIPARDAVVLALRELARLKQAGQ